MRIIRLVVTFAATFVLLSCKSTSNRGTKISADLSSNLPPSSESDASGKLAMHDVSILFPDADDNGEDFFLRANSPGKGGALIPSSITRAMLSEARLVSFRIDPCFPQLSLLDAKPELCQAQIRLVLIPGRAIAAFHAGYSLTRSELMDLTREIAALGDHSKEGLEGPLGVHPKMLKEGIDGPTAREMRKIILKYAGSANLAGLAMNEFVIPPNRWEFRAFQVANGQLVPLKIPTLDGDDVQAFEQKFEKVGQFGQGTGFKVVSVSGNGHIQDDFNQLKPLLSGNSQQASSKEVVEKALRHAAILDNPGMTHFTTTSCLSCHLSRIAVTGPIQERNISIDDPNLFKSAHNLELTRPADGFVPEMRNFAGSTAISQRTVNETAEVVDAMIKHGFFK